MSYVSIDYPDEVVHWFRSESVQARRPAVGPCPHVDCPHNQTSVVAWGPDLAHYELSVCDVDDGCNGNCRGWCAAPAGFKELQAIRWRLLGEPA